MTKKLYSISELINENIKLKKDLEKQRIQNLKGMINLLKLLFPNYTICNDAHGIDIYKIIRGFEAELDK